MRIDVLNQKLVDLRKKWIGHIPKDNSDHDWWAFKCDCVVAKNIKKEIEELNRPATNEELKLFEDKLFTP